MLKNYILALLVFNLSACATVLSVPLPSPGTVPSSINIGDQVEVITLDGIKHKFAVTKIDINWHWKICGVLSLHRNQEY